MKTAINLIKTLTASTHSKVIKEDITSTMTTMAIIRFLMNIYDFEMQKFLFSAEKTIEDSEKFRSTRK